MVCALCLQDSAEGKRGRMPWKCIWWGQARFASKGAYEKGIVHVQKSDHPPGMGSALGGHGNKKMKRGLMKNLLYEVESRLVSLRDQKVLLDKDVAELYGVETKRINEAVRNNPERFPDGYYFELTRNEAASLRSKRTTLKTGTRGQHSKYLPKAFTERGLYMIATILKSEKAIKTTIAIIETFAKIREVTNNLSEIVTTSDDDTRTELIGRSGKIMSQIMNENLEISDTETTIEVNFAMVKFKHTVKRKK